MIKSSSTPSPTLNPGRYIRQVTLPGLLGNVLEWYDFALYGYFAAIISPLFFPSNDPIISLITTFAVFAVGFIMRPLGALLFGYFGDRYGRKNSLAAAILLMAIPTTLMGLLPTYATWGITASLLLTLLRLLQGLAVGGEFTGSIVYLIEHAPSHQRGFYGSLAMSSAFLGLLLGSGVAALTGFISNDPEFHSWVWRIPFLISILLGVIGLYLRLSMPESPYFKKLQIEQRNESKPIHYTFKRYYGKMLCAIALVALPSLAFYLSFVYLVTYFQVYRGISQALALEINTLAMVAILFVIPVLGWLSDRLGRKPIIMSGALGFLILSYFTYHLIWWPHPIYIFMAQFIFAILVSASYAAIPAWLCESFPTEVRYTALSFPYNLANAIFGGTAPLVATTLIRVTHNKYVPGLYLMGVALMTLIVASFTRETKHIELEKV